MAPFMKKKLNRFIKIVRPAQSNSKGYKTFLWNRTNFQQNSEVLKERYNNFFKLLIWLLHSNI